MTKAAAGVLEGKAGEPRGKATGGRLRELPEGDPSGRGKSDSDLRESKERFRLLIDSIEDYAIFMLDPDGRIISWNAGAERIKGYRAEEILGRHFSCFYPPEAVAQGRPEWQLRMAAEQGRVEDEGWRVRKDGRRFWANIVITALFDKEGRLRGFGKVTRDLTERRKIEELEEADRRKDRFLAVLAHELRNPLAAIWNALHLMKQPEASEQTRARAREIAEGQMRRMTRLLDDLLDVARLRHGRVELRREVLDVAAMIRSSLETVQPLLVERRHRLTSAIPAEPLLVNGDPLRMEQVLTNLLVNAAKYTEPGGDIFVAAKRENSNVVIRVRDTGIGIDPMLLPRIFDLFVQAHRRLDRSSNGVGVGLALVKSLVELHGGSVCALSAGPGKGSEFVMSLPAVEKTAWDAGTAQDSGSKRATRRALRVLIADDNAEQADGLALLLQMAGDDVRIAYDGQGVLDVARGFRPQVVLLDIGMPGLNGYEVARRLRQSEETRRALIVAMTGWGQEEDRRRSREAGFDRHLTKPFEPALIEKLLAEYGATIST